MIVEAIGLALIWLAPGRVLAATGAALTGFGYALVYPGLGAEAVRRAPPQSRGLAMGAYTVFLDVALGLRQPGAGPRRGMARIGRGVPRQHDPGARRSRYRRPSPAASLEVQS